MISRQRKVWFVLLLFVHLLVHPALHDFSLSAANAQVSQDNGSRALKLDDCTLCRDASGLRAIAPIALVYWHPVVVQLVPSLVLTNVVSVESSAISPRAPPSF